MIQRTTSLFAVLTLLGAASAGAQTAAPAESLGAAYSALSAQAQQSRDASAGLAAAQPGKSRYEILKDFYEKSLVPASAKDFDLETDVKAGKSNLKCIGIWPADPNTTTDENLFIAVKIIPAVPSAGPLLPGTPEERLTKFYNGNIPSGWPDALWDRLQVSETAADLLSHYDYNGVGGTIAARKNVNLIAFKFAWDNDQTIQPSEKGIEYGYCFRGAPVP